MNTLGRGGHGHHGGHHRHGGSYVRSYGPYSYGRPAYYAPVIVQKWCVEAIYSNGSTTELPGTYEFAEATAVAQAVRRPGVRTRVKRCNVTSGGLFGVQRVGAVTVTLHEALSGLIARRSWDTFAAYFGGSVAISGEASPTKITVRLSDGREGVAASANYNSPLGEDEQYYLDLADIAERRAKNKWTTTSKWLAGIAAAATAAVGIVVVKGAFA